jgi:glycosyltransferase involved in cell wall biosynthesis
VIDVAPLISVVMPVRNAERFLDEAISSVINQTFVDFELLLVDDESTDSSLDISATHQKRDSRLVVVPQKHGGIASAINHGVHLSRGALIARMDADDRALPEWLEEQRRFLLSSPECSVVSSYAYCINAAGKRIGLMGNPVDIELGRSECNPRRFLEIIHPTVLMRKEHVLAVGGYREMPLEDRDLWGRIVTAGMSIKCNPKPLIEYRLHGESSTLAQSREAGWKLGRNIDLNVVRRMRGEEELAPAQAEEWFKSRPFFERFTEWRHHISRFYFTSAVRSFAETRWRQSACTLAIAIATRPLYVLGRFGRKVVAPMIMKSSESLRPTRGSVPGT